MALTKYASLEVAQILEVKGSREKITGAGLDKLSSYEDYRTDDGYLYTRVRAISSRVNKNHDGWPSEELAKAYLTFLGKPIFVDHNNSDPSRARGVIVDAKLHIENDFEKAAALDPYYASAPENHKPPTWVELLLEVDAKEYPKLAQHIINDDIDGVSMGANVERSKCSHCANWATSPEEYCLHVMQKGADFDKYDDFGRKTTSAAYEDCYDIGFFEISYVFDPADETALDLGDKRHAMAKVAARTDGTFDGDPTTCSECGGSGQSVSGPCASCHGRGVETWPKEDGRTEADSFIDKHAGAMDMGGYGDGAAPGTAAPQGGAPAAAPQLPGANDMNCPQCGTAMQNGVCPQCTTVPVEAPNGSEPQGLGMTAFKLAADGTVKYSIGHNRGWGDDEGPINQTGIPAQSPGSSAIYQQAVQSTEQAQLQAQIRQLQAQLAELQPQQAVANVKLAIAQPDYERDGFIERSPDLTYLNVSFAGRPVDQMRADEYEDALALLGAAADHNQQQEQRYQMTTNPPNFWLVDENEGSEINITDDVNKAWNMDKPDPQDNTMQQLEGAPPFEPGDLPNTFSHIAKDGSVHYAQPELPQSMMTTAPESVDTLRQEKICEVCGSDMDDGKCEVCGFEVPPEGFDNPDLEKAQQIAEQGAAEAPMPGGEAPPGAMAPPGGGAPGGGSIGTPAPTGPPAGGGQAMSSNTIISGETQVVRNVTAGKIRSNETPIIPATKTVSDHPTTTTVTKEPTRLVQSNTKDNMTKTLTKAAVVAQMVKRGTNGVKTEAEAEALLKSTGLDRLLAASPASDPAEHSQSVEQVGGDVDNPESGTTHENVEKAVDIEAIPTKTWSGTEDQTAPVTNESGDLGGPIGDALASTKQAGGFPDHEPTKVNLEAPLKEEIGDPTKTFKSDDFHITDPVTTEDSNEVGGPIGTPLSSVQKSQIVAHVMASLKLAEEMVNVGLITEEQKWEQVAQLEQESPEQLAVRQEVISKIRTAGLAKGKVARSPQLPLAGNSTRTASTSHDIDDNNLGDAGLFR